MNDHANDWLTLATTPPENQVAFDSLVAALNEAGLVIQVEENVVRQCENDPAFWLRVRVRDLVRARALTQK